MAPRLTSIRPKQPLACTTRRAIPIRQQSTIALPPPPPASGFSALSTRSIIQITGPDASRFLHGLVTSTIPPPTSPLQTGFYTAFLNAQGRLQHDVFIYPSRNAESTSSSAADGLGVASPAAAEGEGYLLDVDAGAAPGLLAHLRRHKLRSKVQVRRVEDEALRVVSVWQGGERWTAHSLPGGAGAEGELRGVLGAGAVVAVDQRAPGMGVRVLLQPGQEGRALGEVLGLERCAEEQVKLRRYLRGVPEGWAEMGEGQAPAMTVNLDVMSGVDFKKGCYVGQELTIRTYHTGVVRRRVVPVMLYEGDQVPAEMQYDPSWQGGSIVHDAEMKVEGKRGKPGKMIGSVGNVGLALVRLEMMTDLAVTNEPSSYDAEDRFVVDTENGRTTQVKAFVPDWLRGKIRAPKVQKRVEA